MTIRPAVYDHRYNIISMCTTANKVIAYTSGIKNNNFGRKIEMFTYILHMKFNQLKNVLFNKL